MDDVLTDGTTRLGVRADRRGQPRLTTTVAAAGAFVAFSGAMTLAFDNTGTDDGGVSSTPGTLISLAVVVAGYALLVVQKRGPLATAGLVAFAIALPFLVGYATLDETAFPPFSFDAVFGLSALGWGVAYLAGPSRGRPFLLGLALLGAWWFVLEQVTDLFTSPFTLIEGAFISAFEPDSGAFGGVGSPEAFGLGGPDPTEVAIVCGVVAALYLVGSHLLERRGHLGVATPMVAVGHAAAIVAIFAVSDDLEEIGTGIVAVIVGVALAYRGATAERRATTWIGGIYVVGGVQAIISGLTDSATTGGVLLIGAGGVLAVLAAFAASALDEPDDADVGPSCPGGLRPAAAVAAAPVTPETPGTAGTTEARVSGPPVADGPPQPGWWKASDDRWYPPEQHPDARGEG
jgi:hypothetical protein